MSTIISPQDLQMLERMNRHPHLKARVETLLSIAEDTDDVVKADDAERRVIEEVRRLGNETLTNWAEKRMEKCEETLELGDKITRSGKKKLHWHSTFGEIEVSEAVYKRPGERLRPFSQSAGVVCRGCSGPLQRVVVDFGADHAFGKVPGKLQEHYGISLPASTIRHITERHAKRIRETRKITESYPDKPGCAYMVVESDGSMVPIVEVDENAPDKRKGKKESWKEARLSLAHELGKVTPYFGVEFQEGVEQAGRTLFDCARLAGFGRKSYLHAVGDGAVWVREQVEQQFGAQGHYLVDFYHTCEYLGKAAATCAGEGGKDVWFEQQKAALKNGRVHAVIEALQPHIEAQAVEDAHAPVRACHRYLRNRPGQFDYPGARARGLPIGSGEIESAHRYIIQERLKLPGAWWKIDHARDMLALRVMRANGEWESYWHNMAQAT